MVFDLASTDALARNLDDGIDLDVRHPTTGLPIGLIIRLAGYDSDRAKVIRRKNINDSLRSNRKPTAEEGEARALKLQVAVVLGWTFADGLTIDGAVPDFKPASVEAMLRRFPFIAEQIDEVASDRTRFLQG